MNSANCNITLIVTQIYRMSSLWEYRLDLLLRHFDYLNLLLLFRLFSRMYIIIQTYCYITLLWEYRVSRLLHLCLSNKSIFKWAHFEDINQAYCFITLIWIQTSTWNQLPLTLRLLPRNNVSTFCKHLNWLSHFSLAVAGLRAPLSRFLKGRYRNIWNEWMNIISNRSTTVKVFELV